MPAVLLKSSTAELHQRLEDLPILKKLISPSLTREEYVSILEKFWGFWSQLEEQAESLQKNIALDMQARKRSDRLLKDLAGLGVPGIPAHCSGLPFTDTHALLGALYVYEGSTLGGQFILRNLHGLGYEPGSTRYFAGYGPETGPKWKEFVGFLNAFPANEEETGKIVDGACRAFDLLYQWIQYGTISKR